jgi:hypothetical protein
LRVIFFCQFSPFGQSNITFAEKATGQAEFSLSCCHIAPFSRRTRYGGHFLIGKASPVQTESSRVSVAMPFYPGVLCQGALAKNTKTQRAFFDWEGRAVGFTTLVKMEMVVMP